VRGRRIYCDRHYAMVNRRHDGFWRSAIVQIAAMGLFSVVVALLGNYIGPIDDPWRVPVGLVGGRVVGEGRIGPDELRRALDVTL